MTEVQWVTEMGACLTGRLNGMGLSVRTGLKLVYGHEILSYGSEPKAHKIKFETDLAIVETKGPDCWIPRVVVEGKLGSITTHDAITYSQKASTHRAVHPYLRYGIMLGDRKHFPLPGRLYRHGAQFDFMISFKGTEPSPDEMVTFVELLEAEVAASKTLEKILYEGRRRDRDRYTLLHRQLRMK